MANVKEVAQVFDFLSRRDTGKHVEKTSLNKLLYFAQGYSLTLRGKPLFENEIDAWRYGPVVAIVFSGYDKIIRKAEEEGINHIHITPDEAEMILGVWDEYGSSKASELVGMTHEPDSPWTAVYSAGEKNRHIPKEMIADYFSRPEHAPKPYHLSVDEIPVLTKVPLEEYDPEEDAVWEALLNEA